MENKKEIVKNYDCHDEDNNNQCQSITFVDIQEHYMIGSDFTCTYIVGNGMKSNSNDWIGLYKIGWSNSKDYKSYVWAGNVNDKNQSSIKFPKNCINKEDNEFYQFCYIGTNKRMRGASSPFQFVEKLVYNEELTNKDENTGLTNKTSILNEQFTKLMKNYDLILQELTEMKVKFFNSEKKCVELETIIDNLNDEHKENLEVLENQSKELKLEMQLNNSTLVEKTNCLKLAESKITELINKIDLLENKMKMMSEKENENLQKQSLQDNANKEYECQIATLNSEKQKIEIDYEQLSAYVEKLKSKCDTTNELLKNKTSSEVYLKQECEELTTQLSNLSIYARSLEESEKSLKCEVKSLKDSNSELDSLVRIHLSENETLKNSIKELKDISETENKRFLKELEIKHEMFINEKRDREYITSEYESKICEQESIINNLKAEKLYRNSGPQMALQTALDEIRPRFKNLKIQNMELRLTINDLKELREVLLKQLESLQKEVEYFNTKFMMPTSEYKNKFRECVKLQKANIELEKKLINSSMSSSGSEYCKKCEQRESSRMEQDCNFSDNLVENISHKLMQTLNDTRIKDTDSEDESESDLESESESDSENESEENQSDLNDGNNDKEKSNWALCE